MSISIIFNCKTDKYDKKYMVENFDFIARILGCWRLYIITQTKQQKHLHSRENYCALKVYLFTAATNICYLVYDLNFGTQ